MLATSKHIKQLLNKLRRTTGFTIAEMLAAVVVLGLVTMLLAVGVGFATNQFSKSVSNSEGQQVFSTLETILSDELRYTDSFSDGETTYDRNNLEEGKKYDVVAFQSDSYGNKQTIPYLYAVGDDGVVTEDGKTTGWGQLALCSEDGETTVQRLIGKADYIYSLEAQVKWLTYQDGYFEVRLAVRVLGSTDPMIEETFHVRAVNLQKSEVAPVAKDFVVVFNSNGGSGTMVNQSFNWDEAQALSKNTFTAPTEPFGLTFAGWNTEADGSGVMYEDEETLFKDSTLKPTYDGEEFTLYAQWTNNAYTVTFNGNGGETAAGESTYSQAIEADVTTALRTNDFVRDGYTFLGWATTAAGDVVYEDGNEVTNLTSVGDTVLLYAKWQHDVTITFDKNSSKATDPTPTSKTVTEGATAKADDLKLSKQPTRTNYQLLGWYTAATGGTQVLNADGTLTDPAPEVTGLIEGGTWTVSEDTTLYAHWRPSRVFVGYFELNEGSANGDASGASAMTADDEGDGATAAATVTGYRAYAIDTAGTTASERAAQELDDNLPIDNAVTSYAYGVLVPASIDGEVEVASATKWGAVSGEIDGDADTYVLYVSTAGDSSAAVSGWTPIADSSSFVYNRDFGATISSESVVADYQVRTASQLRNLGLGNTANVTSGTPIEEGVAGSKDNAGGANNTLDVQQTRIIEIPAGITWNPLVDFAGSYATKTGCKVELAGSFTFGSATSNGDVGIFGKVTSKGELQMLVETTGDVALDATSDASAKNVAVLVGTNAGSISGSKVTVADGTSLTLAGKHATDANVGLLVGYASAEVSDVELVVDGTATVESTIAASDASKVGAAGSLVGQARANVSGTVSGSGTLTVNATAQAGEGVDSTIAAAGGAVGYVGWASNTLTMNVQFDSDLTANVTATDNTLTAQTEAKLPGSNAGGIVGYAGYLNCDFGSNTTLPDTLNVKAVSDNTAAHAGGVIGSLANRLSGVTITLPASAEVDIEATSVFGRAFAGGIAGYTNNHISNATLNLSGSLTVHGSSPEHQAYGGIVGDARAAASNLTLNANDGSSLTIYNTDADSSGEGDVNIGSIVGDCLAGSDSVPETQNLTVVNNGSTIDLHATSENTGSKGRMRVGGVAGSFTVSASRSISDVTYEGNAGSLILAADSANANSTYVCAGGIAGDIMGGTSGTASVSGLSFSLSVESTASVTATNTYAHASAGGLVGRVYANLEDASISVKNAADADEALLSIESEVTSTGAADAGVAVGYTQMGITQTKPLVQVEGANVAVSASSADESRAYAGGVIGEHNSNATITVSDGVKLSEVTGDRDLTHIDLYSSAGLKGTNATCGKCAGDTNHNTLTQGSSGVTDMYLMNAYLDGMVDTAGSRVSSDVLMCLYPKYPTHDVTFNYLWSGKDNETLSVLEGGTVAAPTDVTRKGYEIEGWYTDAACTEGNEYDFNAEVTGDLTLYAKWKTKKTQYYVGYLEFDGSNVLTGFQGTLITEEGDNATSESKNTLTKDNDIASYSYGVLVPEGTSASVFDSSWIDKAEGPSVTVDGAAYTLWYYSKAGDGTETTSWKPMADYATTYSFEYDFGATLAEDSGVTNREVRTPSQLMHLSYYVKSVSGAVVADVDGNPGNVTNVSRSDDVVYRQTHEIVLSHPWWSSTGVKFSGGTYTQENGVKVTLKNGFALVDSYISGLIPIIEGANVDMDIVVAGSSVVATKDTNSKIQRLGLLAGAVNSGSIEGSSVVVNDGASITFIANKTGAQVEVGLLAGETTSAVTGVTVDIEGSATVQANSTNNAACAGGAIGYAKGAVSNVTTTFGGSGTILIAGASSASTTRVAGVVGHCDSIALSSLTLNSSAANATIQGSASTGESYVGGVVGWIRATSSSLKANVTGGELTIQGSNAGSNSMVGGVAGTLKAAADGVELNVSGDATLNVVSDCTNKDAMACGLFGRLDAAVTVANALVSVDGGSLNLSANAPGASAFTAGLFGYSNNSASAKIANKGDNALVEITNGSTVSIGGTGATSYAAGDVGYWNTNGSEALGNGYALHVAGGSTVEIGKYNGAAATQYVGAVMGRHASALTFADPAVKIEGDATAESYAHVDLYSTSSNVHALCGTPADTGSGAHNNLAPTTTGTKLTNPYLDGMVDTADATNSKAPADSVMRLYPMLPKYTVTFNSDGGSAVDAQQVYKGETATEPATPTKTNYTFSAWYADGETEAFNFAETPITGDITLTASWTGCKVNLDSYRVSTPTEASIAEDGKSLVGYNASTYASTVSGWDFVGWWTAREGGTKVLNADGSFAGNAVEGLTDGSQFTLSEDVTLYARYGHANSTVYTKADSIESGEKYLIINADGYTSNASALVNSTLNNNFTKTGISVGSGTISGLYGADGQNISGTYVTNVNTSNYTIWTVTASGDGYTIYDESSKKYLNHSGTALFGFSLAMNSSPQSWYYNGSFYMYSTVGLVQYYVYYGDSKFKISSLTDYQSGVPVYLYKQATGYSEFAYDPS